jgi:hypothetical protein
MLGGRRRTHMVQLDAVLEDVQDGDHVLGDAGVQ